MKGLATICYLGLLQWTIAAAIACVFVVISSVTIFLMILTHRKLSDICEQKKKNGEDCIGIITLVVASVIVVALIIFGVIITIHAHKPGFLSDFTLTRFGLFGDYFGGFIGTLVAVIVAIYAIRTYKSERELQKEASVSAMLSTMLDLHKQNVNEIEVPEDKQNPQKMLKGREAFSLLVHELRGMYDYVFAAIIEEVNKDPEYYQEWTSVECQKLLAHMLSYGYFYYSVDSYVITMEGGTPLFFLCETVRQTVLNQKRIPDENKKLQRHILLGHYYRHLYNMVNFIDKNTFTNKYDKKEFYVKLIRSQLSDYEQILLYYNSLSTLGSDWNYPIGMNKIEKMSLICKYRLLKNCPFYIPYFGIDPMVEMYKTEKQAWLKEKNELFFETDPKGQLVAFNKVMKLPLNN